VLKPGTYKLTRDIKNPKPDRRVKEDWRAHPVWKAGTEFLVQPLLHKERDDEPTSLCTKIVKVGHRWQHEYLGPANAAQYAALEAALEPCAASDDAFFTEHYIDSAFGRWLLHSGRLSRELLLKLWTEYQEDGHQLASEPIPQRSALVESKEPTDPIFQELFEQIRRGIEIVNGAVAALADEITVSMLVEKAIAEHERSA